LAKEYRRKDKFFHGLIDELAIYPRALTEDEVTTLYKMGVTTHESAAKNEKSAANTPPSETPAAESTPDTVYLWDLPDHDLYSWNQRGIRRYGEVRFNGELFHKSLSLTPRGKSYGRVRFTLDGKYKRLQGAVGLTDSGYKPANAVTFRIVGDDEVTLWESPEVGERKVSHSFDVNVEGVRTLTLYVVSPGSGAYCKPIFLDPVLDSVEKPTDFGKDARQVE
jgi:hypothetical protein